MSVSQQKENNQDGIDISSMLNDVNKVLHQHLTNILTPMLQEKKKYTTGFTKYAHGKTVTG